MRWGTKAAIAALLLVCAVDNANGAANTAPQAGEITLPDGSRYTGEIVDAAPNGTGVLVNGAGDRFTGTFKNGQLDGHGTVVWANGDRYDGDWKDGKAEGHGRQLWADGRIYDGAWHNDQPNGTGTITRKDGSTFMARFVDGKRVAEPAALPPATASAPPVKPDVVGPAKFVGQTLRAIDGSTIAISSKGGSFERAITAIDGTVQTVTFTPMGSAMGAITAADAAPIGFFRITASGVDAEFADGHSESISLNSDGGVSILTRTAGETNCTAWYPQGHVFSAEERKAAVAAYARRLGVAASAPSAGACAAHSAPAVVRTPGVNPHGKPGQSTSALPVPAELQAAANASTAGTLLTVPVHDSRVHPIDNSPPVADSGVIPTSADMLPRDEAIASNCLKVDSDGAYWGFRNHCGYSVQFTYCLLRGPDELTACRDGVGVAGSVSGNGFGALFADTSLSARGSEHAFRWVACRGGAGEVSARLDSFEPASGRCVRGTLARAE
ncbi:MAG: hypothetical protein JO294_05315 [Alphaproteobacteria bacterium]|nr:hypothetical protein [Alphaproteobacteria bacterium]